MIAVLPGDGIGPEVIREAVAGMDAAACALGLELTFEQFPCGAAQYQRTGRQWGRGAFRACRRAEAVLFGAVGLPGVTLDDGRAAGADVLFGLRQGLYANVRPVKLMPGVRPLLGGRPSAVRPEDVNLVVVRENTEGLYAPFAPLLPKGPEARDVRTITLSASRRIIRHAFSLAAARNKRVTCVDKSNLLAGCVLFSQAFQDIATRHPQVKTDHLFIDAAMPALLRNPAAYDVLVTTNLFGDILSDLASVLGGGLGTAPSANLGTKRGMFEPVHGSAPDIAGKDTANPVGAVLSGAMLLEWLSRKGEWRYQVAGSLLEQAVRDVTSRGICTPDIGGTARCSEVGAAIVESVAANAKKMRDAR